MILKEKWDNTENESHSLSRNTFQFKNDEDVNVVNFLPVLMDEYFHYHGSLTTGGCQEAVNWMVFKNPLAVKEKHLKAFQSLKKTAEEKIKNNFRPTQPVNDRYESNGRWADKIEKAVGQRVLKNNISFVSIRKNNFSKIEKTVGRQEAFGSLAWIPVLF